MNIITNDRLIHRNSRIAQYTPLIGMGILVIGMVFLFRENPQNFSQTETGIVWACILVGFILTQVGIYFTNRWGRRPRPDELLNTALKGMGGNYSLYHYVTPVSHLLIGPVGVWVLMPRYQRGTIVYDNDRWKQKGGGALYAYLKIFGQENLGRPDLEIQNDVSNMNRYFQKRLPDGEIPPIQAALIFTDERAKLETDDAPSPTLPLKKLKEFLRKSGKKSLSPERIQALREAIEGKEEMEVEVEEAEPEAEEE